MRLLPSVHLLVAALCALAAPALRAEKAVILVRHFQTRDYPQQGGFAGAGRAQKCDEFAVANLPVDVLECRVTAKCLGDILNFDTHGSNRLCRCRLKGSLQLLPEFPFQQRLGD